MTIFDELNKLPASIKAWGGAVLLIGSLGAGAASMIAWQCAPLANAVLELKANQREQNLAIVDLRVAVAGLSQSVAEMRYRDVPDVSDKVDGVGETTTATRAILRANYQAVTNLNAKLDSVLTYQRRRPR